MWESKAWRWVHLLRHGAWHFRRWLWAWFQMCWVWHAGGKYKWKYWFGNREYRWETQSAGLAWRGIHGIYFLERGERGDGFRGRRRGRFSNHHSKCKSLKSISTVRGSNHWITICYSKLLPHPTFTLQMLDLKVHFLFTWPHFCRLFFEPSKNIVMSHLDNTCY